MAIPFKCPACGFSARVEDAMAGKRGKCPKCGQVLIVPNRVVEPPKVVVKEKQKESRKPKQTSFFKKNWIFLLGIFSLGLFAVSILLVWHGKMGLFSSSWWAFTLSLTGITASILATIVRGAFAFRKRAENPIFAKHFRRGLCASCACLGLTAWLSSHQESILVTALHYAALSLALLCVFEYLMQFTSKQFLRKVGLAVGLVVLLAWWQNDYYRHGWTKRGEEHSKFDNKYVDYHRRGTELPYYREYSQVEKEGFWPSYTSKGHMTEAGSQHGKWEWHSWDWDAKPFTSDMGYDFYWYGEKISEATWHLKNEQ